MTIEESNQRGLSRREWRSFFGRVAHDARRPSIGSAAPEVKREALCGATPGGAITMSGVDAALTAMSSVADEGPPVALARPAAHSSPAAAEAAPRCG
jgi:hypothetical protein